MCANPNSTSRNFPFLTPTPVVTITPISVTTGLLDLMNEDEVLAVIAHELGHIKSGHVLYKTMARVIGLLLTLIGDMTLGIGRIIGRSLEAALPRMGSQIGIHRQIVLRYWSCKIRR